MRISDWSSDVCSSDLDEARRKGATAIAMVFSMPPGTDPELVREAVRELAESDMANRRWVMALHTAEAHPHVHLIIAGRDNDGRRFKPDRAFLPARKSVV